MLETMKRKKKDLHHDEDSEGKIERIDSRQHNCCPIKDINVGMVGL